MYERGAEEKRMPDRRQFLKRMAGTAAGAIFAGCDLLDAVAARAPQATNGTRRVVSVGGKRVKVIDVHAHAQIPELLNLIQGTPLAGKVAKPAPSLILGPQRIQAIDALGIDVQVLSSNGFWWYEADRDLADKLVKLQNEKLGAWCASHPDRFVALTSVALQHPDLAAAQLEFAVKQQGFRGAAIGGNVDGAPLSLPRFYPFWAKAEELGVLVFMHPETSTGLVKDDVLTGKGDLANVIGNPLETTIFLSHMIYEGVLDRFPGLKICAAHAGGYLASYLGRSEVACEMRPSANCANKKHPSEYLKSQILIDTIVNSAEGLRHIVAEAGANQVVYGTDMPFMWPDSVDLILNGPFSDAEKTAMLGGNLSKLLKI
jgi:aminocarboxymuconate-semialdehyde decarboxylase